jgi:hypothetical protein
MPLLHHAVRGTLTSNGQAIELARETDGEIADINHLLHFAAAFIFPDIGKLDPETGSLQHPSTPKITFPARPRSGPVRSFSDKLNRPPDRSGTPTVKLLIRAYLERHPFKLNRFGALAF